MPHRSEIIRQIVERETHGWTASQRAALTIKLARESTRRYVAERYPSPGELARSVDPETRQTAPLQVIDDNIEWALSTPNARLAISMPPQQGKTQRVGVWAVLRALVQDPDRRVVLASYSETLARSTSRETRNRVSSAGSEAVDPITGLQLNDHLGLALAQDKSAAANWQIAGHRGGVYATGTGGSLTGQPADLMIIDDPIKGMTEADSKNERDKVINWWESEAQTRLAPGAPVIIIATRWHEDDLTGHVLAQDAARPAEQRQWRIVNIPAIATPGVPDALDRPIGEPMESARGTTLDDWHRIRANVGERVWSALYLGSPTPQQGGLFDRDSFDRHRVEAIPGSVAARLVAVDPAETGKGDEAGIIAMSVASDGRAYVTDDASGQYTSDQWSRQAVLLTLRTHASELTFEAFTTGITYEQVIKNAWARVRAEAQLLARHSGDIDSAVSEYLTWETRPDDVRSALAEVADVRVPDQLDPPFRINAWRARGDKTARAAGTRQAASTGRLRMQGTFAQLEHQAVTWQQGQSSPDRVDALVQAYERAMKLINAEADIAIPVAQGRSQDTPSTFWSQPMM